MLTSLEHLRTPLLCTCISFVIVVDVVNYIFPCVKICAMMYATISAKHDVRFVFNPCFSGVHVLLMVFVFYLLILVSSTISISDDFLVLEQHDVYH
jgi:hypothetical protein